MVEQKVEIKCPSCNQLLKVKKRARLSKLSCKYCLFFFKIKDGEVLEEYRSASKVSLKPSSATTKENASKMSNKIELDIKDFKEIDSEIQKDKIKNRKELSINWRVLAIMFFIITLFLSFFLYRSGLERRRKSKIATEFLRELKNRPVDFKKVKSYLNKDAKELFEILLESQFQARDSSSIMLAEHFFNSLQSHSFNERQKLSFTNKDGDTTYFYVEFEPKGDSYLLKTSLEEFLK